jgi:hypothetical protein
MLKLWMVSSYDLFGLPEKLLSITWTKKAEERTRGRIVAGCVGSVGRHLVSGEENNEFIIYS